MKVHRKIFKTQFLLTPLTLPRYPSNVKSDNKIADSKKTIYTQVISILSGQKIPFSLSAACHPWGVGGIFSAIDHCVPPPFLILRAKKQSLPNPLTICRLLIYRCQAVGWPRGVLKYEVTLQIGFSSIRIYFSQNLFPHNTLTLDRKLASQKINYNY